MIVREQENMWNRITQDVYGLIIVGGLILSTDQAKRKLEEINLHLFERECAARYKRDRAEDEDEDLEQRMERMEKK